MNDYELTMVLPGDTSSAKKKTIVAKLEKQVKSLKGKLGKADEWGKIEMAYKIEGDTHGYYLMYPLELESSATKELNSKLKMNGNILRYLLIRV